MAQVESNPRTFPVFWEKVCNIVFHSGPTKARIIRGRESHKRGGAAGSRLGGEGVKNQL